MYRVLEKDFIVSELSEGDLRARYPEILGGLADGIQCDAGWLVLIDALLDEITRHCASQGIPVPRARQIKEKGGSLRCYLSSKDAFIEGLVQMAEEISGKTCEICGEPGLMGVQDHVVQVRCLKHGGRSHDEHDRTPAIWRLEPERPPSSERRVPGRTEEGAELWILDLLNEVADDYCYKRAPSFRVKAVHGGDGLRFDAESSDERLEGLMAMASAFWKRRAP